MSYSIYIADDEKNIRDIIKSFLERDGYIVSAFENGDDLMAAFFKKPADLVILDIMMPGTDGLTICRMLRVDSGFPYVLLESDANSGESSPTTSRPSHLRAAR